MGELIPIIAIICTIGLPIIAGWILGLQWIRTRNAERMGLINQGIIPPITLQRKNQILIVSYRSETESF